MNRRNNDGWCYTCCVMIEARTIKSPITRSTPSELNCGSKFTFSQKKGYGKVDKLKQKYKSYVP